MNIVTVTGIFPPDIGGPASYVPKIVSELGGRGHAVEVVTLADEARTEGTADHGYLVHRIPRQMPKPLRMARTVRMIASLARRADVVFANGLVLEAVIGGRIAGRPVVVKVVGDTIWERARNAGRTETIDTFQTARLPLKWRGLRSLQNAYMRPVAHVITPSLYLKRLVAGWGVPEPRITAVYNAVPLPAAAAVAEPAFDMVSVGRLVAWKGFAEVIELAARRGWSLRIVGDGPLRGELERKAQAQGALVRFDGNLPQAHVAAALQSGKVFVLNSSYEGLPHIVLEAMTAGVPVVATAVGGTPEAIPDGTGLLVPLDAADRLEQAVGRLLTDENLRDGYVARARAMLAERFSFERMVADTEAVLARAAMGGAAAVQARRA